MRFERNKLSAIAGKATLPAVLIFRSNIQSSHSLDTHFSANSTDLHIVCAPMITINKRYIVSAMIHIRSYKSEASITLWLKAIAVTQTSARTHVRIHTELADWDNWKFNKSSTSFETCKLTFSIFGRNIELGTRNITAMWLISVKCTSPSGA